MAIIFLVVAFVLLVVSSILILSMRHKENKHENLESTSFDQVSSSSLAGQ
jgi:hypothetical protein